ncbi:SEC10/PgrA surface exclusion domain-containing protein [Lactobacillus xylocopicola]|uniref:Surface exclusion protein n=1 Tax=Lactobacillus xylocopicola TaxID=2976676 RepID=A0ABM8BFN3_9LACO|nr:SEC10/PgrA surface exclusion domain-containing protein [Lactobacillus xylocopicola]BDR60070.1 surface exclusion protein [Lactobacillus xylocopicola]
MKKSKFMVVLVNIILLVTIPALTVGEAEPVSAASIKGYVKVKTKGKAQLYQGSGKRSRFYAVAKRQYSYSRKKKIGQKKRTAYKIGNNSQWILAKDVKVVKKQPVKYAQATMKLPRGYNKTDLLQAYQGKPSKAFVNASMQGMKVNNFSRGKLAESKQDNQTVVNLANLTTEQLSALTTFALRLINEARSDLGLRAWVESSGTQKLAADIATEYAQNKMTIKDGHYVAGIVRACQANGLKLDDNYVEDMAGFYNQQQTMTMTELKKSVYFGLKQMIFGYSGSSESEQSDRSYYQEWGHAGDLFNTQGTLHDGDYNYFGFNISTTNNICSLHFISVPTYIGKNKQNNVDFKP